jgi:N-acetylneuraminic acid mutarotase
MKLPKNNILWLILLFFLNASSNLFAGAWSAAAATGSPPPAAYYSTEVWTGSEMIVWGGITSGDYPTQVMTNQGSRFNPVSKIWSAMSTISAPSARAAHGMIWTGTKVILWGGLNGGTRLNTGGQYNPATDTWSLVSMVGAPSARSSPCMIWTGTHVIVWGGRNSSGTSLGDGAKYNPTTNTWSAISSSGAPSAREEATAIWTGSKIIVWGGKSNQDLNTGAIYDPASDSWTAMTTDNAPSAGWRMKAVWTGTEMVVFCGYGGFTVSAGHYNPTANTWTAIGSNGTPSWRADHTVVWTGSEMLVWGGWDGDYLGDGSAYNPVTKTWQAFTNTNAPSGRSLHVAVWTGSEMIVWGGSVGGQVNQIYQNGGHYNPTLSISAQPAAVTKQVTETATFSVTAEGVGTLEYQWRKNGIDIPLANGATLNIPSVSKLHQGVYDVVVTDDIGLIISEEAMLTVISPAIFTDPLSRSGYAGQSTTFNVLAAGTGTVTYQWRKSGVNIPTATNSSLTLSPLNYRSAADYDVVVTDDFDSATSESAELTVLSPAPNVSISPGDTTMALGGNLTFTATVETGIPPFTYQWRKNSVLIAKATNPTLVLTNIQRTQEGAYDVVVKNVYGLDVSNSARLSLPPLVAVTTSPADSEVNPGQPATFTVDVPGATAWQWLKNGVAIKNATASTLTVLNADTSSAGLYSVTVTTPAGKVTTSAAQLRVTDSGLLIYKLTGTGNAYEGTVSTVAALSGYMFLDRTGQRGGLILGSKRGSQSIHSLEVHENLHTQSTGPVPKTQTVVSEMVADEFVLWVNGADSLLTIQKTLSRTDLAVGPATLKGYANSIDIGPKVRIETVSLTLALDAINSIPARQNAETVEQAMSRISQDMQLKGSALVE